MMIIFNRCSLCRHPLITLPSTSKNFHRYINFLPPSLHRATFSHPSKQYSSCFSPQKSLPSLKTLNGSLLPRTRTYHRHHYVKQCLTSMTLYHWSFFLWGCCRQMRARREMARIVFISCLFCRNLAFGLTASCMLALTGGTWYRVAYLSWHRCTFSMLVK